MEMFAIAHFKAVQEYMVGEAIDFSGLSESFQLARLQEMPVEEIEAQAKKEHVWHPCTSQRKPENGDLVTFSKPGEFGHIGIVSKAEKDGTLHVITRMSSETKWQQSGDVMESAVTKFSNRTCNIKPSEVRGIISKPLPKTAGTNDKAIYLNHFFAVQQNLTDLMSGLLDGGKTPNH